MLNTIGKRLKFCRVAVDIKAAKLIELVNKKNKAINLTKEKYARWETGAVKLGSKQILRTIVEVFKELGLTTLSYNWLVSNSAIPPQIFDIQLLEADQHAFFVSSMLGDDYILRTVAGYYAEPYANFGSQLIIKKQPELNFTTNNLVYCEAFPNTYIGTYISRLEDSFSILVKEKLIQISLKSVKLIGSIEWIKRH